MKNQKVISQIKIKGQDKTPEKQLNEVEIGNLWEKEFRVMIVKMIQHLRETVKIHASIVYQKPIELKNKQKEMNNML